MNGIVNNKRKSFCTHGDGTVTELNKSDEVEEGREEGRAA